MKKILSTVIAAMFVAVSSYSVSAGDNKFARVFNNWKFDVGKDNVTGEVFFVADTVSTRKNINITLSMMYNPSSNCKPVLRMFIHNGEDNTKNTNTAGVIGNDGMLLRVDNNDTYEQREGYYAYYNGFFVISFVPLSEFLIEMTEGKTLRTKTGKTIENFKLSGANEANTMAISTCVDFAKKMNKSGSKKSNDDEKYFK